MRDSTLENGNLYEILLGRLYTLGNGSGNFASLTKSPANYTIAVTDNYNSCEREGTSTLGHLSYTVDGNQSVFQFNVTIYSNFVHCHNRLKIKSTFTSCISE